LKSRGGQLGGPKGVKIHEPENRTQQSASVSSAARSARLGKREKKSIYVM
jgi:hypothetical protein